MAYSSKQIANQFLKLGKRASIPISPMKLQKLVYYAQGWRLGLTHDSLINEQIECWPYGPVIDSLFHEFKEFGSSPITRPAYRWKHETLEDGGWDFVRKTPRIPKGDEDTIDFIHEVFEAYGKYSATKLSNMTHVPGSPWHQVYTQWNGNPPKGTDIPRNIIEEYFSTLAEEDD